MKQKNNSSTELTIKQTKNHRSTIISRGRRKSPRRTSSCIVSTKEAQDTLNTNQNISKLITKKSKTSQKNKKEDKPSSVQSFNNPSSHSIQINDPKPSKPAKKEKQPNKSESTTHSYIHLEEKKISKNSHHSKDNTASTDHSSIEVSTQQEYQSTFSNDDCTVTQNDLRTKFKSTTENIMSAINPILSSTQSIQTDAIAVSTDSMASTFDIHEPHAAAKHPDDKSKQKCKCWSIVSAIGGFIILIIIYFSGTKLLEDKCGEEIGIYVKNLSIDKANQQIQQYLESFNQQNSGKCAWLSKKKVKDVFEEKIKTLFEDQDKCREEIGIYVKKLSIEKKYQPIQQYLESFNQQNSGKCALLSKRKVKDAFEEKIVKKFRASVDKFFNGYQKQFNLNQEKKPEYFAGRINTFLTNQTFFDEKIGNESLTKYFQDKKAELEANEDIELIPACIILSGFANTDLNGRYNLILNSYGRPAYQKKESNGEKTSLLFSMAVDKYWRIISNKQCIVKWENNAGAAHPGKLGTQRPILENQNIQTDNDIHIKTELYPSKEKN